MVFRLAACCVCEAVHVVTDVRQAPLVQTININTTVKSPPHTPTPDSPAWLFDKCVCKCIFQTNIYQSTPTFTSPLQTLTWPTSELCLARRIFTIILSLLITKSTGAFGSLVMASGCACDEIWKIIIMVWVNSPFLWYWTRNLFARNITFMKP